MVLCFPRLTPFPGLEQDAFPRVLARGTWAMQGGRNPTVARQVFRFHYVLYRGQSAHRGLEPPRYRSQLNAQRTSTGAQPSPSRSTRPLFGRCPHQRPRLIPIPKHSPAHSPLPFSPSFSPSFLLIKISSTIPISFASSAVRYLSLSISSATVALSNLSSPSALFTWRL